jgi:uncharacterized membrane protein
MNIPEKEIKDIAMPMASEHPHMIGTAAVVFLLMGVFWEPYLALLALYPIGNFWLEACNNIRWARKYVDSYELEERIKRCVDEAIASGKIDETIEEFRELQKEIPNSKGGGRFIQNEQDRVRWFEMDRVIDALLEQKFNCRSN